MTQTKLCKNCKHSILDFYGANYLACMHPELINDSPEILAGKGDVGINTLTERSKTVWSLCWNIKCGKEGKLWEARK